MQTLLNKHPARWTMNASLMAERTSSIGTIWLALFVYWIISTLFDSRLK